MPTFAVAAMRPCVDTGNYEVYNLDNVALVDIREALSAEWEHGPRI